MVKINLMFLCILLLLGLSFAQQPLELYYASVVPNSATSNMVGSIKGGTTIYISGVGFDEVTISNNLVFIGNYPCKLDSKGANSNFLSCDTTQVPYAMNGLKITVRVGNQQAELSNSLYFFSYTNGATPWLSNIYPSAAPANTLLKFYGTHKITNIGNDRDFGDVEALMIGSSICSRLNVAEPQFINSNSAQFISCYQAQEQEGGKYLVSELVTPGYAYNSMKMRRASFINEYYEFVVVPTISAFTPTSGGKGGALITVTGTGFSLDKSKIKISVDGVDCKIKTSSMTQISCLLDAKTTGTSSLLSTNSVSQKNGYISGEGINYERYNIVNLSPKTIDGFKAALQTNSLPLLQKKVVSQMESINIYGEYYGQVYKGYFKAPVTGTYKFKGNADDMFSLYVSDKYGSTQIPSTPYIYANWATSPYNYYSNVSTVFGKDLSLEANKYYYIEAYHLNFGGNGNFKIDVEAPNINNSPYWHSHQINQITSNLINEPQIMQFTYEGASSGSYVLKVIRKDSTLKIIYNVNVTLKYNSTLAEFVNALSSFDCYAGYDISGISLVAYDGDYQLITDLTNLKLAAKLTYRININNFRPSSCLAQKFSPLAVLTETRIQSHSPMMSGSFGLQIGQYTVKVYSSITGTYSNPNIPYDVDASTLQNAIRQISGMSQVQVTIKGYFSSSATWMIDFVGYNADVPDLVLSNLNLEGGKMGTKPTLSFWETKKYSSNLLFSPVSYQFLYTVGKAPNMLLEVNGIGAICNNNCQYQFITSVPEIILSALSGNRLNLGVSDPAQIGFTLSQIQVTFDGKNCLVDLASGTTSNFQCQLEKNTDNSPVVRAGQHMPGVTIDNIGTILPASNITPITIPLNIASATPSSGGTNGGFKIKLSGHGFPFTTSEATVTLCNSTATVTSISNIQCEVIVPQCQNAGADSVKISYNSLSDNEVFTYVVVNNKPQIFSISPYSFNPSLKSTMEIIGSGFGTDLSKVTVHLSNSSGRIYQLRVLKMNDTYIKTGVSGGLAGQFRVLVNIDGVGDAVPNPVDANIFQYQLVITDVSPASGSHYGGTLIKITGKNFSPNELQNLAYVGTQLNWFCDIVSFSPSQIQCRTPPRSTFYQNATNLVTVESRLVVDSTCGGNCVFTYVAENISPTISSVSSNSVSVGATVTVMGTNFDASSLIVLKNKYTQKSITVVPASKTATTITFSIPNMESGPYNIKVRQDPLGESNGFLISVKMAVSSLSLTSGLINGGHLRLIGTGLPETWPNKYYTVSATANNKATTLQIVSSSSGELKVSIPPTTSTSITYLITIVSPNGDKSVQSFVQNNSNVASLEISSSMTILPMTATSISILRKTLTTKVPLFIRFQHINNKNVYQDITTWVVQGANLVFDLSIQSAKYAVRAFYADQGWATCASVLSVTNSSAFNLATTDMSYNGGVLTLTGSNVSPGATLTVGGIVAKVLQTTSSSTTFSLPPILTKQTHNSYPLLSKSSKIINFATYSDSGDASGAFDSLFASYYSSTNAQCYIGIDIGSTMSMKINKIRYFPYNQWAIASEYISGGVFEGSNDKTIWTQIGKVDQMVHAGWNVIELTTNNLYRYARFKHTSQSNCKLAEFQLYGFVYSNLNIANLNSFSTDVIYNDGQTTQQFTSALQLRSDKTPIVKSVIPANGDVFGGYQITINGVFWAGTPKVVIDGKQCMIVSSTSSAITCTVSPRLTYPQKQSFSVMIDNKLAINEASFMYVMRWSDVRTWGTDFLPVEDDLIHVPVGMNLFVDQQIPRVKGIVVEGTIIFSDEKDMIISAGFINVNKGKFFAGTESKPYEHKLTFVLYGDYYGKQLPIFGNKGIGCFQCEFSLYGKKRTPTWTMITSTINAGSSSFVVKQDVDWQVGQKIAIASTSFDHNEAEEKTIKSISGRTIQVDTPFQYKHFGGLESYGTHQLQMFAEVGLLTRNIVIMGDQTSVEKDYGAHLLMAGKSSNGLKAHIAYTEFTKCGQPAILGRYCIHFHQNEDVMDSYVLGNAVHHSMARVITLHGIHFLKVSWNVGYWVKGHNFFIEDGIETNNVIEYNLAIKSVAAFNMMQTDISVASFWVTNPYNHLRYNHAAGGDFYGFWYEIKKNPDGPSATTGVCPIGNVLGQSHHNVAHSYKRFGLRIFKLASRKYPCWPIRNNALINFWQSNPSIQSKFSDYTLYKNMEAGLLAEETGNTVFDNFVIAENLLAGIEFYRTNLTQEFVRPINSAIIGISTGNADTNLQLYGKFSAIITPRTDGLKISNIDFYNMQNTMTVLEVCSKCYLSDFYINTARQVFIEGTTYTNVTSNYMKMNGLKREIVYDVDGSFTGTVFDGTTRSSATVVNNWKYFSNETKCKVATSATKWPNMLACDETITIRRVMITNPADLLIFQKMPLKIQKVEDPNQLIASNSIDYEELPALQGTMQPMDDKKIAWGMPMITNRIYNLWWLTGLDFTHIAIDSSRYATTSQSAIILRFNYTQQRELFQISHMFRANNFSSLNLLSSQSLDAATCSNGDYYNNINLKVLDVCVSAKGKTNFEYVDINAVKCKYLCSMFESTANCVKQNFVRIWNNASQWPNSELPKEGQNVSINCNWTMIMDIQPPKMDIFLIDGDLFVPDTLTDAIIEANNIYIRAGSLNVGEASKPYPNKFTIKLNGNKADRQLTVDPQIGGNKMLVVTGKLNLYGTKPSTLWTKLTQTVFAGQKEITVQNANGWAIGDTIVLSPTFSNSRQEEKRVIANIVANVITLDQPVTYTHYGAPTETINNSYGILDTRGSVGHLTRNIKIVSGSDTAWGYRVVGYAFNDEGTLRVGSIKLHGVQMQNGGQPDTQQSTLRLYSIINDLSTEVIGSTFYNCKTHCLDIKASNGVRIQDNVFYKGTNFHVKAFKNTNYIFRRNLMIAAVSRTTVDVDEEITCYSSWEAIDVVNDNVAVTDNVCQGSEGHGFFIPHVPCDQIAANPFQNNLVGSAKIGYILNKVKGTCMGGSGLKAYACTICHMAHPHSTIQIKYSNFMMADCQRAITLRFGKEGDDRTGYLTNSYITAISRPTCTYCYGNNAIKCSDLQAIRLLTVTINGQAYPTFGLHFDVICRNEVYDCKAFLTDLTFQNYKTQYSDTLPQCSNNFLFRRHPGAADLVGSHHLSNSKCINCDMSAMARFDPPNPKDLGWFGGCGNIPCTGPNNYLIQDHDGTFLPGGGTLLANNSVIGDALGCQYYPKINGYHCLRNDLGVLQYESIAPDYNTRIMWPVNLTIDGESWTTQTNGYREWQWQGNQPLNKRLGRFISVIQYQKVYNMTFAAMPPIDMRLQFQRRTIVGNNLDWILVKLHYPMPNSIRVQVGGNTIRPYTLGDKEENLLDHVSQCGANKFFYENYTIHFIITGLKGCQVRVSLTNTIQLTIHFEMNIADFYNMDGKTKFIDRICALLDVTDTSRLKIVGIYNGSVKIVASFQEQTVTDVNNATLNNNTQNAKELTVLSQKINKLYASGSLGESLTEIGFGKIIFYNQQLNLIEPTPNDNHMPVALIVGVIFGVIGLFLVISLVVYVTMKKNRVANTNDMVPQVSEQKNKERFGTEEEIVQ